MYSVELKAFIHSRPVSLFKILINYFPISGLCGHLTQFGMTESLRQTLDVSFTTSELEGDTDLLVKIPFAGSHLSMHLIFTLDEPWFPPDIVFNDLSFQNAITESVLSDKVREVLVG